jgi:hypothetical protein
LVSALVANPQRIVLVAVLVIAIETSQVEHEDEEDALLDLSPSLPFFETV